MQRRASLVQGLMAVFAISQVVTLPGCAQPASGGGTGGTGGSSSGTGGSGTGTGGSGTGTGGSHTGGSNGTGGSSNGTGGSNPTGAGGSSNGTGGSSNGTGGSSNGTGGTANGGAPGVGGARACAAASSDVIADFEDGTNTDITQGGRQGWWSAFGDTTGTQTPAGGGTTPSAASSVTGAPSDDTCDKYAFHASGTGRSTVKGYTGFGAGLNAVLPPPTSTTAVTDMPVDVSGYDGISFNIKSNSGTAPPIFFEIQNKKNVPTPNGTAQYDSVDQYNTRGMLLTGIGTTWTKVYAPFSILAPRYLPSITSSACSNTSTAFCQAPAWDPTETLHIQWGIYDQFAVAPFVTSGATLNFDLWVDDVTFYKGNMGLGTLNVGSGTTSTFPTDGTVGSCTKPNGATGKVLVQMYNIWKSKFVTGSGSSTRVQRPENANDTVSEGIGYGMLIAVSVGDKTLFDNLWSYAQGHTATGMLMNWCVPGGGGGTGSACSASGGTATDADEDMAFALYEAGKKWGGTYMSTAQTVIGQVWSNDIDATAMLPTGGSSSNYHPVNGHVTNPSYFAPAYYRIFAMVDTGHDWNTVATNSYTAIANISAKAGKPGLVPAWCTSSGSSGSGLCNGAGSNGASTDGEYQYDAHRVPWRVGLDYCFNGSMSSYPASGKTFLMNNASFFASQATNGIGRLADIYQLSGTADSTAAPNSMSLIGTAGVGAMAIGNSAFANTAWQFVLDGAYSPASLIPDSKGNIAYTYFNGTVGLLTALTMSGNFAY